LRKTQSSIVAEALQMTLDTHFRIVWSALRSAVEVDIVLDLEPPNVLFQPHQLIFDRWFRID
jgi:hypothetical protein